MSYGSDFAHADPVNAPLDPTVFIGADPVFWAALVLALAAALLAGWHLGARSRTAGPDAAQAIWQAIDRAAKAAMQSDDNALRGRAEALAATIAARLGKTLALTGPLSKTVSALDKAITGEAPAAEPHAPGGHGDHPAAHDSHPDKEAHGSSAGGPAASAAAAASVTIIAVGPVTAHPPQAAEARKHHHKPEKRELTQREQTDALRLAVAAFNEHWRRRDNRVAELRAAHAELSNPGSRGAAARIGGTGAH